MKLLKHLLLCLGFVAFLTGPMLAVAAEEGKAAMPAPAGKDLWDYLSEGKYQKSFALWPGKGNYMPDKKLAAITVMYKVVGYNPEIGDWFWARYTPDGKVEAEGKSGMADMCIGCHGKAKGNDFLFTGALK